MEQTRLGAAALRQANAPYLREQWAIGKTGQRRIVRFFVNVRALVAIEINNLVLIHLRMTDINLVSMKNDPLMDVSRNTMLVPLTAMVVLSIQMCMGRRPPEHHKGGKQQENKRCVGTLPELPLEFRLPGIAHDGMNSMLLLVLLPQQRRA